MEPRLKIGSKRKLQMLTSARIALTKRALDNSWASKQCLRSHSTQRGWGVKMPDAKAKFHVTFIKIINVDKNKNALIKMLFL